MPMTDRAVADADRGNWVDRWAPLSWRPYARLARLDRPIGWWLLLWPCWWSAALAAVAAGAPYPNPWHLVLFLVGAIVMRGAGCTYNDVVDRDVDAQVTRTRSRPIPSGQVSAKHAFAFAVALSFVGLAVLVQFNWPTIFVATGSLVVVAAYPFAKRITDWPQMVLGLAFSWGAFLGWTAVFGRLDWAPVALYLAAILWTIGYDTIYAHQDRRDDAIVGIRSTARLFGRYTKLSIGGLFVATVVALAVAFALAGAGAVAYLGLVAFAVHLAWQVITLDEDDPARCLMLFRANRIAGWMPFLGLVADAGLRAAWIGA